MPSFLSLLLTVGNYMNGGTKLGQADGFRLDLLKSGGIDAVRDNLSKGDLRRFIISMFLDRYRPEATLLLKDLRLVFKNIRRTLVACDGGSLKVHKQVKVSFEHSCKEALDRLQAELKEKKRMLEIVRQSEEDAACVPAWLQDGLDQAESKLEELSQYMYKIGDEYRQLLAWFGWPEAKETTESFFLLWDDFLIPTECFEAQQPTKVRGMLKPIFCDETGDIDVYGLGRLWEVDVGGLRSRTRPASVTPCARSTSLTPVGGLRSASATVTCRMTGRVGPLSQDLEHVGACVQRQSEAPGTPRLKTAPALPKPFGQGDQSSRRGRSPARQLTASDFGSGHHAATSADRAAPTVSNGSRSPPHGAMGSSTCTPAADKTESSLESSKDATMTSVMHSCGPDDAAAQKGLAEGTVEVVAKAGEESVACIPTVAATCIDDTQSLSSVHQTESDVISVDAVERVPLLSATPPRRAARTICNTRKLSNASSTLDVQSRNKGGCQVPPSPWLAMSEAVPDSISSLHEPGLGEGPSQASVAELSSISDAALAPLDFSGMSSGLSMTGCTPIFGSAVAHSDVSGLSSGPPARPVRMGIRAR